MRMSHMISVFANSCIRVPVDPVTKMPKSAFERKHNIDKTRHEQCSIDSSSTVCVTPDVDAETTKDFYRSIPDYNDINHLPPEEFYTTLRLLRDKKNLMLGHALDNDDVGGSTVESFKHKEVKALPCLSKKMKSQLNSTLRRKYSEEKNQIAKTKNCIDVADNANDIVSVTGSGIKREPRKTGFDDTIKDTISDYKNNDVEKAILPKCDPKPKRNHSACSISWNDQHNDVDEKFDKYFEGKSRRNVVDHEFMTRSMPTSPLRHRREGSPSRRRKSSITIPKPFKMTERDEEERIVSELACLRKSLSDGMLHRKRERQFRARPVPIESRIPLYEKILEDQAMRRAITKINSEADLRAQMKPFSFTKREENSHPGGFCERAVQVNPKPKKKKRFRARPVPKNLFSNYVYDKLRENEFFRTFNRRIRAEEMLKNSSLPGSMATRSRLSTPAAHSDLPIDPSPAPTSSGRRTRSPAKDGRDKNSRKDFITTSPQPFHLSTAERAAKKMEEVTRKIYQDSKSSVNESKGRSYSALELQAQAGRSNLAALLRAEAVRSRFDLEAAGRLAEYRRKAELRVRDRLLRSSNPAWHLVKNNHEEDIAMRLQTRRDEERLRREEFLHEMELMYGRVQQQPMLFERYYAPRSSSALLDSIQLSPRKNGTRRSRREKSYHFTTPARSRKVSIHDANEAFNSNVLGYLNRLENDEKYSDSEAALESLEGGK